MKNVYLKYARRVLKSDRVMVHRVDDDALICDGASMLRMPYFLYGNLISPMSPVFPRLEPGQRVKKDRADVFPVPYDADLGRILAGYLKDYTSAPVRVLPFLQDLNKDRKQARLLASQDGALIALDETYYAAVADLSLSFTTKPSARSNDPVVGVNERLGVTVVICPVRVSAEADLDARSTLKEVL